jgi:hypothetical protein
MLGDVGGQNCQKKATTPKAGGQVLNYLFPL